MKKIVCLLLVLLLCGSLALAESGLPAFSTTDMEGHAVTQDIFADYDLTAVNVWATWCGYCLEEMPCFSQLKTMLPDNVNFITICTDASIETNLVKEILRDAGANFQTLVDNKELTELLSSQVYAYPTTFFLDSKGVSVVDPLVGVPSLDAPADAYYGVITGVLRKMKEQA